LVIGGGLMGCATAFDLAIRGYTVIVAEKNGAPGLETTAKSGAIIRAHYGVPQLVEMALEANRRFIDFHEIYGGDAGFSRCGYSVLVDENDVETLKRNVEMQRGLGVDVQLIAPVELREIVPAVKIDDVALVAYEKDGGYALPAQTIASFSRGAKSCGTEFLFDAPVLAARAVRNGWHIELGSGEIVSCDQIVICTGNWSRGVGRIFGLELPVVPMRAQIVVAARPSNFAGDFPIVSDLINLAYFRAEGASGMWVGSSDSADLADFQGVPSQNEAIEHNPEADEKAIADAQHKASLRFEGMEQGVERAFCGLYETTPDWQPIIDSFETVHVAVGFSGHGFKLSTVIGEEMACRIEGKNSPFPTEIFDLERFQDGRTISSTHSYERAKFLR
jgi:sarcosine oxidase subunit beta